MNEYPLKRDHFKRKASSLPAILFQRLSYLYAPWDWNPIYYTYEPFMYRYIGTYSSPIRRMWGRIFREVQRLHLGKITFGSCKKMQRILQGFVENIFHPMGKEPHLPNCQNWMGYVSSMLVPKGYKISTFPKSPYFGLISVICSYHLDRLPWNYHFVKRPFLKMSSRKDFFIEQWKK